MHGNGKYNNCKYMAANTTKEITKAPKLLFACIKEPLTGTNFLIFFRCALT
jgi:hypothetical protein